LKKALRGRERGKKRIDGGTEKGKEGGQRKTGKGRRGR